MEFDWKLDFSLHMNMPLDNVFSYLQVFENLVVMGVTFVKST